MRDKIGIVELFYLNIEDFKEASFRHKDARVMDVFSKITVYTARQLSKVIKGNDIDSCRLGIVLATSTGSYSTLKEFHANILEKSYVGINPSKFPNVMISTPLCRVAMELQAKGPSVPMFTKNRNQAIQYGVLQIKMGRCDTMMVLFVEENKACFALALEKEETALKRGLNIRFII